MKERIEDLGRIYERIKALVDHEIFDSTLSQWRCKDAATSFMELNDDKKEIIIHATSYQIKDMKDHLYAILEIARGDEE